MSVVQAERLQASCHHPSTILGLTPAKVPLRRRSLCGAATGRVPLDRVGSRRDDLWPGQPGRSLDNVTLARHHHHHHLASRALTLGRMRARRPHGRPRAGFCSLLGRVTPADAETAVLARKGGTICGGFGRRRREAEGSSVERRLKRRRRRDGRPGTSRNQPSSPHRARCYEHVRAGLVVKRKVGARHPLPVGRYFFGTHSLAIRRASAI
jgi:hypothetical protein